MPKNKPKKLNCMVLEGFCINVTPTERLYSCDGSSISVTVLSVLNFKFLCNVEKEGNINVH